MPRADSTMNYAASGNWLLFFLTVLVSTDHGIIPAERIGHVFIGFPIVFPALAVNQIPILIFSIWFEIHSYSKSIVLFLLHRRRLFVPIVEITDEMYFL